MDDEMLELRLDALAFGGEAVGRDPSGRVVFVSGGAPGDLALVRIRERKKKFARAEWVRLLEPGEARVEPPCPIAGECGGCPWQHVALPVQLAAKEQIVRRALERVRGGPPEVAPILAAPAALGYRVRARFTARAGRVGFLARRSHQVVDVRACPALVPALDEAMGAGRQALGRALGEGGTLSGRVAPDGRVQLALTTGEGADRGALAAAARALLDGRIVGVQLDDQTIGERALDVGEGRSGSASGFAQANAAQNQVLRVQVAREALGDLRDPALPRRRILELYAGDGNLTRDLVQGGAVVAVEADRAAARRLGENVSDGQLRILAESAHLALARLVGEAARFDVLVLDPPRAGAAEALEGIAALAPSRIVYVSCDPMTLARDVDRLAARGYRVLRAQPIDMMPHTFHVEVVCTLVSAASRG